MPVLVFVVVPADELGDPTASVLDEDVRLLRVAWPLLDAWLKENVYAMPIMLRQKPSGRDETLDGHGRIGRGYASVRNATSGNGLSLLTLAAERRDHTELFELDEHRLALHRGTVVGVKREPVALDNSATARLVDECGRKVVAPSR